jgi:AcrR family transcriptional regulator
MRQETDRERGSRIGSGSRRRRGDVLIESIYQATVEALQEGGYTNLTFQKIAQMTRTSRTVLYRRWETPFALIREIMVYKSQKVFNGEFIDKIEDTGSLRGDFLLLLTLYQSLYREVGPEIMNAVLFEVSQNSANRANISQNALEQNIEAMRKVLAFALARGEKIKDVSPLTLSLPFDLMRLDMLLHRAVIDASTLERLVDEILLPVFLDKNSTSDCTVPNGCG